MNFFSTCHSYETIGMFNCYTSELTFCKIKWRNAKWNFMLLVTHSCTCTTSDLLLVWDCGRNSLDILCRWTILSLRFRSLYYLSTSYVTQTLTTKGLLYLIDYLSGVDTCRSDLLHYLIISPFSLHTGNHICILYVVMCFPCTGLMPLEAGSIAPVQ